MSENDNITVLVADDKRATRTLISKVLKREGYNVVEAVNGLDVLHLVSSASPRIILMDLQMPEMDGLTACTHLKQSPRNKQIPVLAFTGMEAGDTIDKVFEAGAEDFIVKPMNWQELLYRIQRLLSMSKLQQEKIEAERRLNISYKELRHLSLRLLTAFEEERERIARDLHDEVGMALTTLKLDLQLMGEELIAGNSELRSRYLATIDLVQGAINSTRNTAGMLRPPALENEDFCSAAQGLVESIQARSALRIRFHCSDDCRQLTRIVSLALYRCLQEALTNVRRHSQATEVDINFEMGKDDVKLRIADNGVGFDVSAALSSDSLGLKGMRERVNLLAGSLQIHSRPEQGTLIIFTVPIGGVEQ
ncbi:MAG: response regulator [Firmicutes bacterium]|nr:response regulator [Bacillota bacterium]